MYSGTDPQLKRYFTNPQSQQFISFAMRYYDTFNNPQGFIETKKTVSKVFSAAFKYKSVYGEQVYLFDGPNAVVYPLGAAPSSEIFSFLKSIDFAAGVTKLSAPRNNQYVLCSASALSSFRTVIVHMLALQSQMNPHFLYNSIAAIQSMAEEGMDREIIIMCLSMSNILRYISSDTKQEVTLDDEILYTQDYLSCMMIRYQGDLTYSIDIPE